MEELTTIFPLCEGFHNDGVAEAAENLILQALDCLEGSEPFLTVADLAAAVLKVAPNALQA